MRLQDLVDAMERVAPAAAAEPWDNVGLLLGDSDAALSGAMLCIDLTRDVLAETLAAGCDAVVAYHPLLFKPVQRLRTGDVAFACVRAGVGVCSPHTAFDAAVGGTNDVLADALYLTDRRPLRPADATRRGYVKLVTFVPPDHADAVADALFAAGAGHIGDYDACSFRTPGVGTFRGGRGTNPTVGTPGNLETTPEIRLETVIPHANVAAAVAALRHAHPYEEPAFDLIDCRVPGDAAAVGMGRVGTFDLPVPRDVLIARVKHELKLDHVLVAGPLTGDVATAAVGAGSGGDLLGDAISGGADFFLTGELRHHDALRAAAAGVTVCCTLHSASERPALARLRDRLAADLPGLPVHLAAADRDPFAFA